MTLQPCRFNIFVADRGFSNHTELAPSPRVLAYLKRLGRYPSPSMAVVTTNYETHPFPLTSNEPDLPPPPAVAITPCDPWPRPYFLENGLRRVAPYHYTYNTYCKQRWRGREILDIFAAEFRDRSRGYYKKAIETGQIVINGKPCHDIHTIVKNGDIISHTLHRHEPPVTAQPIRVISESDSMIVINKPAGVPVHPAGRYNYNSVVEIMRAERHFSFNPLPCNRLDRLTSGVMFIGKTSQEAEVISEKLRGRAVRKEYIARVKGRFPDGEGWDGDPMKGGIVKCEQAILQISPVLGLNRARASGKSAKTLFRRLAYYPPKPQDSEDVPSAQQAPILENNSTGRSGGSVAPAPPLPAIENKGYSIVHCLPLTGRTHQIRVHLQFLGHPITNDPIYSNRRVFGPDLAQNDASGDQDAEIIARLKNMGKTELADALDYPDAGTDEREQVTVQKEDYFKPLNTGTLHAEPLPPPLSASESASDTLQPTPSGISSNPTTTAASTTDPDGPYASLVRAHDEMVADYNRRKGEKMTGHLCPVCQTPLYSDPGPQELGIYLHALAYSDLVEGGWTYRTPFPDWALPPPWSDTGPRGVAGWEEGAVPDQIGIGDEVEEGRKKNEAGLLRNKGLVA